VASYDNTLAPSTDDMIVLTWRDVSDVVRRSQELSELNARVTHEATHDSLTGLPNRTLLLQRMDEALARRRPDTRVGLVFIDVDHFKLVNDQFGHIAGDRLLKSMATTLLSIARSTDCVARIGGDEFVVLLPDLPAEWSAEAFLNRVIKRLTRPVLLDSGYVTPSASLGLVLCPPAAPDVMDLLRHADAAMYESKRAGRGRATVA
jgi:diguanylate cyclase (GGDEF)-like protein